MTDQHSEKGFHRHSVPRRRSFGGAVIRFVQANRPAIEGFEVDAEAFNVVQLTRIGCCLQIIP